jgi:hypothetical protein
MMPCRKIFRRPPTPPFAKKILVSVPFKGLGNFFPTFKKKGQKIFFPHSRVKTFFSDTCLSKLAWNPRFWTNIGTMLVYNHWKSLNNSTFYHLKSFIALPIQMICLADPDYLPCQSSFAGVSHPPTPPPQVSPLINMSIPLTDDIPSKWYGQVTVVVNIWCEYKLWVFKMCSFSGFFPILNLFKLWSIVGWFLHLSINLEKYLYAV